MDCFSRAAVVTSVGTCLPPYAFGSITNGRHVHETDARGGYADLSDGRDGLSRHPLLRPRECGSDREASMWMLARIGATAAAGSASEGGNGDHGAVGRWLNAGSTALVSG